MINTTQHGALSFNGLGIAPKLLEILAELNYSIPTPIQLQSIPASLERKDMVGIAQTGTGKTLAFGIPMLQLLAVHKGMGLVVLPTRELALQVDESLRSIGEKIGLRTAVLIGGEPINKQLKSLKQKPHIIIATPGRLIDHTERRSVNLSTVKILVLDEADMMLDMGFLPQIKAVLRTVPKQRQTMLFSATMPSEIVRIASEYMSLPTRIEVAPAGTSAENVEQELIVISKENKFDHLKKILSETKGSVLIFMRTKHAVKTLTRKLSQIGFNAAEIHSNRSLGQRKIALEGFKMGRYRILIATDIAARGIDVKEIELVINFDLPEKSGDYVHRIGRTARAGKSGKAISFVMPNQIKNVREIEKLINKTLKINKTPEELRDLRIASVQESRGAKAKVSIVRGGGILRQSFGRARRPGFAGGQMRKKPEDDTGTSKTSPYSTKFKPVQENTKRTPSVIAGKKGRQISRSTYDKPAQRPLTDREKFRKAMSMGRR